MRDVENDLVDAYVRGTLDADTRTRFESFYMSSPRRRAKVRFARAFLPDDRHRCRARARARDDCPTLVLAAAAATVMAGLESDVRKGVTLFEARNDCATRQNKMVVSTPFDQFARARELLLHSRHGQEDTRAVFRWPTLDAFNWVTHWFDELATGNRQEALRIVSDTGVERVTFADMADRSRRVARYLDDAGVERGDRMLVMLTNVVPLWVTILAAMRLGIVVVPGHDTTHRSRYRRPHRSRPDPSHRDRPVRRGEGLAARTAGREAGRRRRRAGLCAVR